MKLYPAILTESETELLEQLVIAQSQPAVETVQIDVIDGFFADAVTVTPLDLAEVTAEGITFDLHLMTVEPQDFVYEAVGLKSWVPVRAVIAQVEQMSFQADFLAEVKVQGWQAGLSLNLFTPLEAVEDSSWEQLDILQLMGVEAGSQGQTFNPAVMDKIVEAKKMIDELDHPVELIVDGGVTLSLLEQLRTAGVESVAVGSAIWKSSDPQASLREFLEAVA